MKAIYSVFLVMFVVVCFVYGNKSTPSANTRRILLIPGDHPSHVNFFCVLGKTLKDAGHDTYVLTYARHERMVLSFSLKPLFSKNVNISMDLIQEFMNTEGGLPILTLFRNLEHVVVPQMKQMMLDSNFMRRVTDIRFDYAVVDGLDLFRMNYLIPYKLGIRYCSLTARPDPWTWKVPALPSVEGQQPLVFLDQTSGFVERFLNFILFRLAYFVIPRLLPFSDSLVTELVPERSTKSFQELFRDSDILLINADTLCLDTYRISAPNYIFVGGLGAHSADPLPPKYVDYLNQSPHGVIVVTFGSAIAHFSQVQLKKMLDAFRGLSQNVLMRYKTDQTDLDLDIPKNVWLESWLPQNDLLANPNVILFITHGGNNGQLEAVFHGVPMLTMPIFGDQMYNAKRSESRAYGKTVDFHKFTSEELRAAILEIINNKRYRDNIQKCSAIIKSLQSPQDTARMWIEHVIEHGAEHLRPYYFDMPIWKFYMVDVILSMLILVAFLSLLSYCFLRFCYKVCRRNPDLGRNDVTTQVKKSS